MNERHSSASERKIANLEHRLAELEQMRREYSVVLNYLIVHHPAIVEDHDLSPSEFRIYNDLARELIIHPTRTEIRNTANGRKYLSITLIFPHNNGIQPPHSQAE